MNSPAPAARTEIFRTRISEANKLKFAQASAARGMRSATHAHQLMLEAINRHFGGNDSKRKEASCRPVKLPSRAGYHEGVPLHRMRV